MAVNCMHCGAVLSGGMAICQACGRTNAPGGRAQVVKRLRVMAAGMAAGMKTGGSVMADPVSTGSRNLPAMCSYLVLPAVAYFFVEPYRSNRFLRFHAIQSLLFPVVCVLLVSLALLLASLSALLGWLALILVVDACGVLFVVLLLKAYRGEAFRLPWLGDLAAQQAGWK